MLADFFSLLLDLFLAGIECRAFRIAQIATVDADEEMDLVHVVRSAAFP